MSSGAAGKPLPRPASDASGGHFRTPTGVAARTAGNMGLGLRAEARRALWEASSEWPDIGSAACRPGRFASLCLTLLEAAERSLAWTSPAGEGATHACEDRFHVTHDDLGFAVTVGHWELNVDVCQDECVRIGLRHTTYRQVHERLLPPQALTAARARAEVLGYLALALETSEDMPRLTWNSNQDPACTPGWH
jgi:hypothetical protein